MTDLEIQEQQKKALGIIWKCFKFNKTEIAKYCEVQQQTVYLWFRRGRVSALSAIKLEMHEDVTITKEEMRPDVKEWFGV